MIKNEGSKKFGLFDPKEPEIAKLIPGTASRVKIQDIDGQEKWRDPKKFENGDSLILENGEPRCMMSKPGRKSKKEEIEEVFPESTTEEAADRAEQKRLFIEQDQLKKIAQENPDDERVLSLLLEGLAEEAASLSFERSLKESRMQETSQISLRRANILKTMGELFLKRKEQMSSNIIDLKTPHFFILFTHIVESFKEAMEKAHIDPDAIQVVMENLMREIKEDSWANQATRKMKGEI